MADRLGNAFGLACLGAALLIASAPEVKPGMPTFSCAYQVAESLGCQEVTNECHERQRSARVGAR